MADVEMFDVLAGGGPSGTSTQNSTNVDTGSHAALAVQNKSSSLTAETPCEGMEFATEEDAHNCYKLYAQKVGFGIRKENLDKSRKAAVGVIARTYVCNRAGRKRLSDRRECGKLVHRRPDTRVDCTAMIKIKLTSSNTWVVSKFVEQHKNHDPTSSDKTLNCLSGEGITPVARMLTDTCGSQGSDRIRARKNNISSECVPIIRNLQDRQVTPNFYFIIEVDDFCKLRSVFWADGRSREAYLSLGDVVVFDITYRANHLGLPFASFTGVNHHRQPTLFGCALLADEEEDTFVWLFTQWLGCMHGIAPAAIITDCDAPIREAIKIVFPNTRHRLCPWHVCKQISEQQVPLKAQYGEDFSTYFNSWYQARTVSQCKQFWEAMKKKFEIDENAESWLSEMYILREYWVDAYLKDTFWAGMTISQRSGNINAFFDGYVDSNTQVANFLDQYDKAVTNRRASESQEDFITLSSVPPMRFGHPIEVQAGKSYSREILKLFQTELTGGLSMFHKKKLLEGSKTFIQLGFNSEPQDKWEEVCYDQSGEFKATCTCAMFETDGILCRHILHVIHHNQMQSFPDSYILHRWKIDARHGKNGFANVINLRNNEISKEQYGIIRLWALRAKLNRALELASGSEALMSKLESMVDDFIVKAKNEARPQVVHVRDSQIGSQVGSSAPLVVRDVEVPDPDGPEKSIGHPRGAIMLKPGFEASQKKIKQQRRCGKCGELGHYRTSCTK